MHVLCTSWSGFSASEPSDEGYSNMQALQEQINTAITLDLSLAPVIDLCPM